MSFISEVFRASASALIVAAVLALPERNIWAADVGLSLLQAQRIAVERSRQLEAQDAAATASRSMAIAAMSRALSASAEKNCAAMMM